MREKAHDSPQKGRVAADAPFVLCDFVFLMTCTSFSLGATLELLYVQAE